MFFIEKYLAIRKKEIDKALDKYLPLNKGLLSKAMRYSIFSGGKRIRPILTIATVEMLGAKKEEAILPACAIEFIHNFSLIHDDLPCIDNDNYRRGKLTLHKIYNETIALLTGNALLSLAFAILVKNDGAYGDLNPSIKLKIIKEISQAIGIDGLVGGEIKEISSRGKKLSLNVIDDIYMRKTAALILAAVRIGAIIGGADKKEISLLTNYGENIGIAFQITDDILEFINGEAERKKDEPNYVFSSSLKKAKTVIKEKIKLAKDNLCYFGQRAKTLLQIADYITYRKL